MTKGFRIPGRLQYINEETAGELLRLIFDHYPEVVDSGHSMETPKEIFAWRYHCAWRSDRQPGIAAHDNYLEAIEQHLVDANDLERSPMARYVLAPEDLDSE